ELRIALRIRPDLGEAHFELGKVLDALKRGEEAAAEFDRSFTLDYKPAESLISKAAMLGRLKRFEEAQRAVDEGLKRKPDDARGWEVLGGIRYQQADRAGALAAWDRSLQLQPDNARLREFVGKVRAP